MGRRVVLWFFAVLLFAGMTAHVLPRLAAQQADTGNVVGQVKISRGDFPPERIEVTLESRGGMAGQAWTDNEGRFGFYGLLPNVYHLIINDAKYDLYRETVVVNPTLLRTNVVSVTLYAKRTDKADAPQPQVSGQNPYVVDAAYARQFSKKVLKEFEAGVKEREKGKPESATKHFQAAIALAPDFYPAYNNLGTIYVGQGRFDDARAQFEAVLKLNQGDTQAYFNLGNVYLLTSQFDDAKRVLEEGIRRQPQVALGHFLLGTVLARTRHPLEAEHELRKAQEIDPLDAQVAPRTQLELVNLYLQEQRTPEAIAELKVFLKKFPEDPMAPRARQVLARLEGTAKQ